MKSASSKDSRQALFSHSVFGQDNVYKSPDLGATPEYGSPSPAPTPLPVTPTPNPSPVNVEDPVKLPVKRLCQNGETDKFYWWKYKYVSVVEGNTGVIIRIEKDGVKLCEITGDAAKNQIVNGQVTLPNECLGGMARQAFLDQLAYTDRNKPIKFLVYVVKGAELVQINDPYKKKGGGTPFRQHDPSWVFLDKEQSNPNCDAKYSPLFFDMRAAKDWDNRSRLSPPANGVQFNILGDYPVPPLAANQRVQISWFTDSKLMLLTLPDTNGRVNGINELFGDNTKGPDGERADHGFHALAKWDANADGAIDARDPVFTRLRLWSDANFNGLAEPLELRPLKNFKISRIEIEMDPNTPQGVDTTYREMDRHKNEIMFKSVAYKIDGSYSLVFDVWFALPK